MSVQARTSLGSKPRARSQGQASTVTRKTKTAYIFLLPYLVIFVIFMLLPALFGFFISFTDWRILGTPEFVGVENFERMLNDRYFWQAFRNTLAFTGMVVPLLVGGGLGLAVLLNMKLRGRLVSRTVVFIPYAIMVTVVGILWRWIYDQNFGLLNFYVGGIFPALRNLAWLTSIERALPAVALTTVWWQIGTNMIIYLAGLQEIPEELYDAARVDGANTLQQFRFITLPSLYLTHIFVIPMSVIGSLRVFGQVVVMTAGGPVGSTSTLVQHLYNKGWINQFMGEAAAVGLFLFVVTFILTIFQLRYFKAL